MFTVRCSLPCSLTFIFGPEALHFFPTPSLLNSLSLLEAWTPKVGTSPYLRRKTKNLSRVSYFRSLFCRRSSRERISQLLYSPLVSPRSDSQYSHQCCPYHPPPTRSSCVAGRPMEKRGKLGIIFSVVALFLFLILFSTFYFYFRWRWAITKRRSGGGGDNSLESAGFKHAEAEVEELLVFSGGEHLRTQNILEAPGEVVGKSSYGTLYRATVLISVTCGGRGGSASSVLLLRFIRPACIGQTGEILAPVRLIGLVRHPNLVPLRALYVGPRGEKLFVHPFYAAGNLAQFLKGGSAETKSWKVICELCLGIARGIEHLHSGLQKPIIHGNLKSKNILLGADLLPRLSDFGLHLLLTPTAAQEMLEASASQGYKAPELIKMKEATRETDIYSLGIVFLEILTRKDASSCRLLVLDSKISDTFRSHLINVRKDQSSNNEELLRCYQLAISCCSPLPAFRPDIKYVIKKLEGIGQS